jgi:hypothetical protein
VVARFSPAVRQKHGTTRTHFTLQRKHALNTTIGLDTETPWPGGLRVTFALADFVDFGKDVPDVARGVAAVHAQQGRRISGRAGQEGSPALGALTDQVAACAACCNGRRPDDRITRTPREETNVLLASTWAVLVALTGAGPMAPGPDARRDRVVPWPPELEERLKRETLLKVMETVPWAATEVDVCFERFELRSPPPPKKE